MTSLFFVVDIVWRTHVLLFFCTLIIKRGFGS